MEWDRVDPITEVRAAMGASAERPSLMLPLPKCMHTGISVSSAAAQIGSQWSVWKEGKPRLAGLSGTLNVLAPLAAHRSSSLAAAGTSQNGMITKGMYRA